MVASGKSTYARRRADEGALVISYDDLAQMLHAGYRYDAALRSAYAAIIRQTAAVGFAHGRDVILDGTHLTRESRQYWVEQGRAAGARVVAVQFPVGPADEHAARRCAAGDRGKSYAEWLAVAERQRAEALAEPVDAVLEGFDAVIWAPSCEPAGDAVKAAGRSHGVPVHQATNTFAIVAPWGTWTG